MIPTIMMTSVTSLPSYKLPHCPALKSMSSERCRLSPRRATCVNHRPLPGICCKPSLVWFGSSVVQFGAFRSDAHHKDKYVAEDRRNARLLSLGGLFHSESRPATSTGHRNLAAQITAFWAAPDNYQVVFVGFHSFAGPGNSKDGLDSLKGLQSVARLPRNDHNCCRKEKWTAL